MSRPTKVALVCGFVIGSLAAPFARAATKPAFTVRKVTALGSGNNVEVEIATDQAVVPQTQTLTGPDRLILDFPNSVPAASVHNIVVNRGEVKGVRVGLFGSKPVVTRVVVDLKTAQTFQVFPSGKSVIVKVGGPTAIAASNTPAQPPIPAPRLDVRFQRGKLSLWASGATLSEILVEVRKRTGADIVVPGGADQEQVFANYGPAPAREVLAALLNGSRFNFVMVASDHDPTELRSVLLIPRGAGVPQPAYTPPETRVAQVVSEPEANIDPDPAPDSTMPDEPPAQLPGPAQQQPPQR